MTSSFYYWIIKYKHFWIESEKKQRNPPAVLGKNNFGILIFTKKKSKVGFEPTTLVVVNRNTSALDHSAIVTMDSDTITSRFGEKI